MAWIALTMAALVIVLGGARLARYGDVIGEKLHFGQSWTGVVLLAATTSLPELFAGVGSTVVAPLPAIAVGSVLGSCMFNLLILSIMDAVQPEPLGARAHQGHAVAIGFGLLLLGVATLGLVAGGRLPVVGWVGVSSLALIALYVVSVRVIFRYEQHRRAREAREVAEELKYAAIPLSSAIGHYIMAATAVVIAALWLPSLASEIAQSTGLGDALVGSVFVAATTSLPEVVVSLAAVRIGAVDLGVGNVLGSNLFNLLILGVDDVLYRQGDLLQAAGAGHEITTAAIVVMNALFLIGLTFKVMTKRFVVSWDTGAIAAAYVVAVVLTYVMTR